MIQLVGLFGYGAVFVLLAGELVMDVTRQLSHDAVHLSFCYWLMLIAIPLAVLMWLGSPKDFGYVHVNPVLDLTQVREQGGRGRRILSTLL